MSDGPLITVDGKLCFPADSAASQVTPPKWVPRIGQAVGCNIIFLILLGLTASSVATLYVIVRMLKSF